MSLNVDNDGIEFINIYSKAHTTLGRDLSNFSNSPFTHPKLGYFQSVEAAWYYLLTGAKHDELRQYYGFKAKMEGKKFIPEGIKEDDIDLTDEFKENILECIQCKLRENKNILLSLISTDLPLEHFYAYGTKIVNLPQYYWLVEEINRIRVLTKDWYLNKYEKEPNIPLKLIK